MRPHRKLKAQAGRILYNNSVHHRNVWKSESIPLMVMAGSGFAKGCLLGDHAGPLSNECAA